MAVQAKAAASGAANKGSVSSSMTATQQVSQPPAGSKKNKKQVAASAKGANGSHVDEAAHAATMMEKAPSRDKLDDSVKLQPKELAEEAEKNAALAAVDLVTEKQNGGSHHDGESNASTLHTVLSKRIKVLTKKLQRATSYAELSEDKLNADMKRIVASKGHMEGALSELTETLKAVELAEKDAKKQEKVARNETIASATQRAKEGHAKELGVMFQLLHLHSLINASMQASFAPPPLPTILQQATSQQVAAIGKLVADLTASSEVNSHDDKSLVLSKLVRGSPDTILEGVSFKDILSIVEGLSTSAVQQTTIQSNKASMQEHVVSSSNEAKSASILFMQASEIDSESLQKDPTAASDAPNDVAQAEPEGGAVDGVAISAIAGGATEKGHPHVAQNGALHPKDAQDGTAKAQVNEPVTTTKVSAPPSVTATPKVIDWSANDDDDFFGDLDIQPDAAPVTASAAAVESQKTISDAEPPSAIKAVAVDKQATTTAQRANDFHVQGNAKQQQRLRGNAPVPKTAPEIDEDGFTVASSKRTKHLQQLQQQAQSPRNARGGPGRGVRGGSTAGAGGRGGSGRGRGRGRGAVGQDDTAP